MMLGYLLARLGVNVTVLEKHGDFLRDFRGDTIHPSTLDVMYELGLLDDFLKLPHQEVHEIHAKVGDHEVILGDFTHLPTRCKYVALIPQWDFLDFLKDHARCYPNFQLRMNTEVTGLIENNGAIAGVEAKTAGGAFEIRADLTIGADGRHSVVRRAAGMKVIDFGAPMDVMWLRLRRSQGDPQQTFGHADRGRMLVLINREDYWQIAFVIPKGEADQVKQRGIGAFRETIAELEPYLRDRVGELRSWDDVSLLTVKVDRLEKWSRAGLLCIGDAAHAMSPIGGVGINLAIQDAVAAANLLGPILVQRAPTEDELKLVQKRREFPTKATQRVQLLIQDRVVVKVLGDRTPRGLAWPLKLLKRWPYLRRWPARLVGVGFRPEHVQTPAAGA